MRPVTHDPHSCVDPHTSEAPTVPRDGTAAPPRTVRSVPFPPMSREAFMEAVGNTSDAATPGAASSLPDDLAPVVKRFLRANPRLDQLVASHRTLDECVGYCRHSKVYEFPVSARVFMQTLEGCPPAKLWNGASSFQVSYDRNNGCVYGRRDPHPPLRQGMVVLLSLNIALGYQIPVAFEIVRVDPTHGEFAFSYVTANKSLGIQRLRVSDTPNGCRVVHETRYQSNSPLRDRFLYPLFHERLLDEFYANLSQRFGGSTGG